MSATPIRVTKSEVRLIPWDPESPSHVSRLIQQRTACGWKQDWVESWRQPQREGKIALQWVVLLDFDTQKEKMLSEHTKAYPTEATPIQDSASSFGGKPCTPTQQSFIPVGHISLDYQYEFHGVVEYIEGWYWVCALYISSILQGFGLGRAAMDVVEQMASREPLNAKGLILYTAKNDETDDQKQNRQAKYKAMGKEPPKVSVQDWYARRGFIPYRTEENMWYDTDPTGKRWGVNAVFMKKDLE